MNPLASLHKPTPQPQRTSSARAVVGPQQHRLASLGGLANGRPVAARAVKPQASPVQRKIVSAAYDESNEANAERAKAFFQAYDNRAQAVYRFVIENPGLDDFRKLNGYTKRWALLWKRHVKHGRASTLQAAFGYVIESLLTGPFAPDPPDGCTVVSQVTRGGTRPDLVLFHGGKEIAWLDLTASKSRGHIFNKDSWEKKISNFAEVTYPSLTSASLAGMLLVKGGVVSATAKEFHAKQKEVEKAFARNKRHWTVIGKRFRPALIKKALRLKRSDLELDTGMQRLRDGVHRELVSTVGEHPITFTPSLLTAMGVSPLSLGFGTGFSQSVHAGEAFLTQHAPAPPGSDDTN